MRLFILLVTFVLLLILKPHVVFAQESRVVTTDTLVLGGTKFPKGVYRTKEEFLARKPSYLKPIIVDTVSLLADVTNHGWAGDIRIKGIDSMSRRKIRKRIFAYCNGENLYVNTRLLGRKYGFRKVLNTGPVWYMQAQDENAYVPGGLLGYALVSADPASFYRVEGVYFTETEMKLFNIDGYMLEKLLSDNPDLLSKLKAEKRESNNVARENRARKYLDEYNASKKQ